MKKSPEKSSAAKKRKTEGASKLKRAGSGSRQTKHVLRLYISGSTPKSAQAVNNIKRVCEHYLKNRYDLEVIDLYQQPDVARDEQIVALPTLVKQLPLPLRKLIGDLSSRKTVLLALDLIKRES